MANVDVALRLNNNNNNNNNNNSNVENKNDNNDNTCLNDDCPIVDEKFEYRGYHKFGRILGRGSFGTVIECVRKQDAKPIALKLVRKKGIYKWVPESYAFPNEANNNNDETKLVQKQLNSNSQNCLIPMEVACLLRASKINGVIRLLEYWPSIDTLQLERAESKQTTTPPPQPCRLQLQQQQQQKDDKELNQEQQEQEQQKRQQQQEQDSTKTTASEPVIGILLERNYNEECLFDYLIEKSSISEIEAKILVKQIVEINLNLLRVGILHGDLKSENMLIDRRTKRIKLIDFGSAEILDNNNCSSKAVKTFRGTNLYKPPEYLLHHCFYPRPSTVWTIGIILYNMVTGDFPFQSETEVLEHKTKDLMFDNSINISDNLKDLIKKCLAFYAADRIIIEKVLTHPWLTI